MFLLGCTYALQKMVVIANNVLLDMQNVLLVVEILEVYTT